MKKLPISLEEVLRPVPFSGEIGAHPFVQVVENYLRSIDLDPHDIRRTVEGEAAWSFITETGLSVFYRLYKDRHGEVFIHLEAAFGCIPEVIEEAIFPALLIRNGLCHMPMSYGLGEGRLAIVVFRSYAQGITPEHFLVRLASLVDYAEVSREEFSKPQYGLQPLPLRRVASAA